jgi:hypothetical protein
MKLAIAFIILGCIGLAALAYSCCAMAGRQEEQREGEKLE